VKTNRTRYSLAFKFRVVLETIEAEGQGAEAGVRLFAIAFGSGFGWHAIVDEVAK